MLAAQSREQYLSVCIILINSVRYGGSIIVTFEKIKDHWKSAVYLINTVKLFPLLGMLTQ